MPVNVDLQPKQLQLLRLVTDTAYTMIGYGGSNGGAKSHGIRDVNLILCTTPKPQPIKTLIFRRKSNDLLENHIIPFFTRYPELRKHFNKTERIIYWTDGSTTKFGSADKEDDINDFEGKEYDYIFIDEATHCSQKMIEFLRTRNRSNSVTAKMIFTMIPGFIGHNYIKRLFITKQYLDYEQPAEYVYLPARVWDNVIWSRKELLEQGHTVDEYYQEWNEEQRKSFTLQYSDYAQKLSHLPEQKKRARLYGDWFIFEGQFFDEWYEDYHVIEPADYLNYSMIRDNFNLVLGMDYGKMSYVYLIGEDYDKNIIIFDEWWDEGGTRSEKIRSLKAWLAERKILDELIIADTNMWIPDAFDVANTTIPAQEFIAAGIKLVSVTKKVAASGDMMKNKRYRVACNDAFKDLLHWEIDSNGKLTINTRLKVYRRCHQFIEYFPALITDEKDVEDIAKGQYDHCFVGNTKIATLSGYKRIKNVKEGEYILTRIGFNKVLKTHRTENQETYYYPDMGLQCTSNHPIITNNGIKAIHDLTLSDILYKLDKKEYLKCLNTEHQELSKLMGLNLDVTQHRPSVITGIITGVVVSIMIKALDICMYIFGKENTSKKYQRVIIFITKMGTGITTQLVILNVKKDFLIYQIIQRSGLKKIKNGLINILKILDRLLTSGTSQKKEGNLIHWLLKKVGAHTKCPNVFARFVRAHTKPMYQLLFSVHQNVIRNGKEIMPRRTSSRFVNDVRKNFLLTNSQKQNIVQEVAQRKEIKTGKRTVYNLTVEDNPEYYANGVLVHNCYDGAKYGLMRLYKPYDRKPTLLDQYPWLKKLKNKKAQTTAMSG